jgi:hypothetical protein
VVLIAAQRGFVDGLAARFKVTGMSRLRNRRICGASPGGLSKPRE